MPDRIEHRGFFASYEGITNELTTPVNVLPASIMGRRSDSCVIEVTALWDTGAVGTCIKPWLKDSLNLRLLSTSTLLEGVGGNVRAYMAFINIQLAHNIEIEDCLAHIAEFPGNADILIGMDIISMGDFAVCNTNNVTSFSFVIPPFPDRINFIDKADTINKQNA